MNLQLSLKRKWFKMTEVGTIHECYRDITPYWCKKLLETAQGYTFDWYTYFKDEEDPKQLLSVGVANEFFTYKDFDTNTMILWYPKSADYERIMKLEHKGIEIREGREEWGAKKGKLYFVIKHGKVINN